MYCAAVLDAFSRRIVGWSIDSTQDSTLVVNALDMAIKNRQPTPGGIVHADHGVRKRWKTRTELANAIFDYIEIFYNRQRRHSQLGYEAPITYELAHDKRSVPA